MMHTVRELIYLSQGKLKQFQPETRKRFGLLRRVRSVNVKAPIGEIGIDLQDDDRPVRTRMAHAINQIENSDGPIRWFADHDAGAGEWIAFEARMNYESLAGGSARVEQGAVFFWEPDFVAEGRSERLVLHGNKQHLVGDGEGLADVMSTTNMSTASGLFDFLRRVEDGQLSPTSPDERYAFDVSALLDDLHGLQPASSASWMAGYARLTMTIPASLMLRDESTSYRGCRVVVASPLYVERVSPPIAP